MENQILIQKTSLAELKAMIGETMEEYLRSSASDKKVPAILTWQQAAKMLNVSPPTLHYRTKEGIVKATRIGTRIRYRPADIEAALVDIDSLKYKRKG